MRVKKNFQISIITILVTFCSYAQNYEPVISSDSTTWDIAWKELYGNEMSILYSTINKDSTFHDLYLEYLQNTEYVGKIREDSVFGKIWYTPSGKAKDEEYLIMNLSLEVGDTFNLPVFNTTITTEVVDVYYVNQRKYIEFDYQTAWDEPLRFIEGVGRNIAMHHFWFGDFTYIPCKYNDGELIYVNTNPNFIDCELNTIRINSSYSSQKKVYPNPAKDVLFVDLSSAKYQDVIISIYDMTGTEVYNNKTADKHTVVQLSTFNKGLYFIKIFYKNKHEILKLVIR